MLLLDPQELEYLLEHLGHPETLKEKKFQEWLLDNDHRQLFERVRDYREAYLRVDKGEMIDLAKEWEQFEVNVQKKSGWGMRRIGVVAASGLIFLLIGMLWQPTEIETVKVVREAELIGKKSAELILSIWKNKLSSYGKKMAYTSVTLLKVIWLIGRIHLLIPSIPAKSWFTIR